MCRISLEHKPKAQIRPEAPVHHKPSLAPKYEYVEVAKLVINPDHFINHTYEFKMTQQQSEPQPPEQSEHLEQSESGRASKCRSNIQNAIEFSQFGNKQNTSRIIITEPMLEGELIIPIVVRRIVNASAPITHVVPSHGFDGEPHYLTTYSKNNDPRLLDARYETTHRLIPIKCKTTYDVLRNTFLNKIMTRFTGPNATRRAYQNIDFSGKGVISKNDLKTAFMVLGIHSITDHDFNLLYLELAGQPNKMIMYHGFKNYIEKYM